LGDGAGNDEGHPRLVGFVSGASERKPVDLNPQSAGGC